MEVGKRSLVSIFEHKAAHEPDTVWVLQPKNNGDQSAGLDHVTYKACMAAVDHAIQWLHTVLPSTTQPFDAFAYQGPSDLRVPLLCLAAAKMQKQLLLPSRGSSPDAQRHLIQTTQCVALVHAEGTEPMFDLAAAGGAKDITAPELSAWLFAANSAPAAPLNKPWSESQDTPWIILHTSGTTGLPKPVRYTHKMMAKMDIMPRDRGAVPADYFSHQSWFSSIPLTHFVGLCVALMFTTLYHCECILGPVIHGPPIYSIQQLIDVITYAQPTGLLMPPADIEKLTATPEGWAAISKVECINFVGAQLRKSVGDALLRNGNKILYGFGTTEAGAYPQTLRSDDEWAWITIPKWAGATFERYPGNDDVYELVFYRDPKLERLQQVFLAFPDLDVFRTKDLFIPHPNLADTWQAAGRSDDFFKLVSGNGVFATPVENKVLERAGDVISAVMMAGAGRQAPCLLVMPKPGLNRAAVLEKLWPVVEEQNRVTHPLAHIRKELIMVVDSTRPFKLNGKGAISRLDTLQEFSADVDQLYRNNLSETSK